MNNAGHDLAALAGQIRRVRLELASAGLSYERHVALEKTVEEALSLLESEQTRQRRQKSPGRITVLARAFYRKTLYTALLLTRSLRFVSSRALWLAALLFLIRFGFQFFPHPPKWDHWGWVVRLNDLVLPVLAWVDSVLEWPEAVPFYPLAVAFFLMVGTIVVDTKLTSVCAWLRKKRDGKDKRKNTVPYGGPSPISWLGANPYAAPPLGRPELALRDPHSSW